MKVEIEYMTNCVATIYEDNGDSWSYNSQFRSLQEGLEWAEFMMESRPINFEIEKIYLTDADTGELLATCRPEVSGPTEVTNEDYDDYDSDWGYNEDMGFDPYCGCYTDDC